MNGPKKPTDNNKIVKLRAHINDFITLVTWGECPEGNNWRNNFN